LDSQLKDQLMKAMLSSKKMLILITAKAEIPFAEIVILTHIYQLTNKELTDDGVRVTCIKDQTHISLPAVSQQLRILEQKGFIERKTTVKDRRITLVTLTPAGYEILKKVIDYRDQLLEKLVLEVGEENIWKYIEMSNRIMNCLEDTIRKTE